MRNFRCLVTRGGILVPRTDQSATHEQLRKKKWIYIHKRVSLWVKKWIDIQGA
jgi:hypothetical protein